MNSFRIIFFSLITFISFSQGAEALTTAQKADLFVFNADEYRLLHSDVRASGIDPRYHWDNYGKSECRQSSFAFSVKDYLRENGDLRNANGTQFSCVQAVAHYIAYGYSEGRITGTANMPGPELLVFDSYEYRKLNPDLTFSAFPTDKHLKAHWIMYGRGECRSGTRTFSPAGYLASNGDLNMNCVNAINHFLKYGFKEKRLTVPLKTNQYPVRNAPSNEEQRQLGVMGSIQRMGPDALKGLELPAGYPVYNVTGMHNPGRDELIFGPEQNDLQPGFGFNGIQIYNEKFGVSIDSRLPSAKEFHKLDVPVPNPKNLPPSDLYTLIVSQEPPTAWRPWQNSNGYLLVDTELSLPFAGGTGGGGSQIIINFYVYDTVAKKGFWYGANIFDTRPEVLREYLSFDGCATCTQQANSAFPLDGVNSSITLGDGSMTSTSLPFKGVKRLRYSITGQNLINTVRKFKQQFPGLSTLTEVPANYQVNGWNFNPEVFTPNLSGEGWIGLSFTPVYIGPK